MDHKIKYIEYMCFNVGCKKPAWVIVQTLDGITPGIYDRVCCQRCKNEMKNIGQTLLDSGQKAYIKMGKLELRKEGENDHPKRQV